MEIEPKRVELTTAQKTWVKNFWTWVGMTFLGFKTPAIPDMIPRYTPDGRMLYVPAINPHLHHIRPIGTSIRVDHNPNYNRPDNIIPLDASYHVGKGVREGDDIEDEVIHQDQMHFLWEYGPWKKAGEPKPTPMDKLQAHRRELTGAGLPYHNTIYDSHLHEQVDRYLNNYMTDKKTPWPLKIVRKK
jgi:hypothetical protein